jgi:hypothetical protein
MSESIGSGSRTSLSTELGRTSRVSSSYRPLLLGTDRSISFHGTTEFGAASPLTATFILCRCAFMDYMPQCHMHVGIQMIQTAMMPGS